METDIYIERVDNDRSRITFHRNDDVLSGGRTQIASACALATAGVTATARYLAHTSLVRRE